MKPSEALAAHRKQIREIVPTKTKEWLTTEDAARLSGFSRPFIIALLDGPLYTGQVTRTDKGHRRVNRSEFEDWLKKASVSKSHPNTVAQVRAETQGDDRMTPSVAIPI